MSAIWKGRLLFCSILVLCVFNTVVIYLASTNHMTAVTKVLSLRKLFGTRRYLKTIIPGTDILKKSTPTTIVNNSIPAHDVENSDKKPQKTKLIILGYKHGGTSVTGAIISSHPKVFYAYEPIWYLKDPDRHGVFISDVRFPLRDRVKNEWQNITCIEEPLDFMLNLLNCHLTNVTRKLMKYNKEDSRVLKSLDTCLHDGENDCYNKARQYCAEMQVTSLKTVRLSIEEAGQLMFTDPHVKVLYVIRDPRGNRNSRKNYRRPNSTAPRRGRKLLSYQSKFIDIQGNLQEPCPISKNFELQCQIMSNDIRMLLMINPHFKDRILTVRYEDLVDRLYDVSSQIFQFLNLNQTAETLEKLAIMTSSKENTGDTRMQLVRRNSSETAMKWRTELSFELAKRVQQDCSFVFESMGYNIFQTEADMRDLRIPSRIENYLDTVNKAF